MTNERAKALLEGAGKQCEPEPDWIEVGLKPDFYCSNRDPFWCEVKALRPQSDNETLFGAYDELKLRAAKLLLPGRGIARVNGSLEPRDARVVILLLERALRRFEDTDAPDRVIAIVPSDPVYDKFVRFSISTADHPVVEFHSCMSAVGRYGRPFSTRPDPYFQTIRMQFFPGEDQSFPARDVLDSNEKYRIAIEAWPDERTFEIITVAPAGSAKELRSPDRIRNALASANSQFKNAIKYKLAPCLLMLFHDDILAPEEEIIISALYGDLKYVFSTDGSKNGELLVDRNGAWNPNKNRTTSAAMFVRNGGPPILVHNYWADRPFPRGVFSCREIVPLSDGTFDDTG